MPYQALLFDIGGVLVRTEDLAPRQRWERRFGLPEWGLAHLVFDSPVAVAATSGQATTEAVWAEAGRQLGLAPEALRALREDFWAGDRYDQGLIDFIRSLRPRYKTGIISNAWPEMRAFHQARLNAETFDLLVFSAEEGVAKPAPEIYQRALARLGVAASEAVFVDDVAENVAAARALGMAAVHFTPGTDVPAEFARLGITPPRPNQWQAFFDAHAPHYMENSFTQATTAEVDFIEAVLQPPAGGAVLDVGCGAGRHSVALAQRGYAVTGLDLSAGMLAQAARAAEAAGVRVTWHQQDATRFTFAPIFDAAICLCEGAFGLLGLDDDPWTRDLDILRNVHHALKPGAPFLLTTLNASALLRRATPADIASGRVDPVTLVFAAEEAMDLPEGQRVVAIREKHYTPPELALLLQRAGFEVAHLWGGTAGQWGRRPPELDEMEIMAVARKPAA